MKNIHRNIIFYLMLLLTPIGFGLLVSVNAGESLVVTYKVRSMYFDPSDKDVYQSKYSGKSINGVPDYKRYESLKDEKPELKAFYGTIGGKHDQQSRGAIATAVWLERAKDGKFIKTLGRWVGNNGYNGKNAGVEVKLGPYVFVQGDTNGRAYDMFRFNGMYDRKVGNAWIVPPRAPGVKNIGIDIKKTTQNPYDKDSGVYDAVMGATVGTTVKGRTLHFPDDPSTIEEDGTILSTIAEIPGRSNDNQPKAWNLELDWNPKNNNTEPTHLPPGDYNIIIEAIEWAMEHEYYGSMSSNKKNTKASQQYMQQFDHIKTIAYTYDGKSWKLKKGENTNDLYPTETMSKVLGRKVKEYKNPFTGNDLKASKNEPSVIYEINVNYSAPD